MNRAERRRLQREDNKQDKLMKWLLGLNFDQRQLLTEYCKHSSTNDLYTFASVYDMVLRVKLYELFGITEGEKILSEIAEEVEKEGIFISKNHCSKGKEYIMKLNKDAEKIFKAYEELKNKGYKEKEIIEELKTKFSKYSATSIRNTIAEKKRDLKKAAELNNNIDEKIEKILEVDKVDKQEVDKPKENSKSDLVVDEVITIKEISRKLIADASGQFGNYHIEDNKVHIDNISFSTSEEVETLYKAEKKALEEQIKLLESKKKERETVLEMYIK